jgi:hypothetical protein
MDTNENERRLEGRARAAARDRRVKAWVVGLLLLLFMALGGGVGSG